MSKADVEHVYSEILAEFVRIFLMESLDAGEARDSARAHAVKANNLSIAVEIHALHGDGATGLLDCYDAMAALLNARCDLEDFLENKIDGQHITSKVPLH